MGSVHWHAIPNLTLLSGHPGVGEWHRVNGVGWDTMVAGTTPE